MWNGKNHLFRVVSGYQARGSPGSQAFPVEKASSTDDIRHESKLDYGRICSVGGSSKAEFIVAQKPIGRWTLNV